MLRFYLKISTKKINKKIQTRVQRNACRHDDGQQLHGESPEPPLAAGNSPPAPPAHHAPAAPPVADRGFSPEPPPPRPPAPAGPRDVSFPWRGNTRGHPVPHPPGSHLLGGAIEKEQTNFESYFLNFAPLCFVMNFTRVFPGIES